MNKNITVRELINKVNEQLTENLNKPIIKKGYDKYDTINGRNIISLYRLNNLINEQCGISLTEQKFDLYMYNSPLRIKTKRKKSGMSNWNSSDCMTISEIYIENEDLLDKTIAQIEQEKEEQSKSDEQSRIEQAEKNINEFNEILEKFNMTFDDFKIMKYRYEKLNWRQQQELHGNKLWED